MSNSQTLISTKYIIQNESGLYKKGIGRQWTNQFSNARLYNTLGEARRAKLRISKSPRNRDIRVRDVCVLLGPDKRLNTTDNTNNESDMQ